ncbi:MAG: hypothetical protein IJM48_01110 [Treponema sp.]|nr:hypothetical protein [Treponema sp.]
MDFSKIEETREDNSLPEENLVFHYSRAERLKRAPKIVQDYYSGNFKPYKGGLLKSLVSTRANRLLFVTIVFAFGIILFMRYFGPEKRSGNLMGVDTALSVFSYEDSVYASVKFSEAVKKHKEDFAKGIPVYATFTSYDGEGLPLSEVKVTGKYEGKETFLRTTFSDYDTIKVTAVCGMGDGLLSLESPVEKR